MAEEIKGKEFYRFIGLLGAGSSISTVFEDTKEFSKVAIVVNSNRAGRLEVYQSIDGQVDDYLSSFDLSAGTNAVLIDLLANYVRVKYTNTSTALASVRLMASLRR